MTTLPVSRVEAVNMLEEDGVPATAVDGAIDLAFRPFEIKTLRMKTGLG